MISFLAVYLVQFPFQYYDNIEKEIENKQMAKIVTIHFVNDKQQCEKLKINIGTQENQCFLLNKEGDIKKTNKRDRKSVV